MAWLSIGLVGVSLGMVGSGGSILTVPILVYLFGVPAVDATAYSLALVGVTSMAGALVHRHQGGLDPGVLAPMAVPSMAAAFLMRQQVVPHLPARIALGSWSTSRDSALMFALSVLIAAAAVTLLRRPRAETATRAVPPRPGRLAIIGVAIGSLAGLVGAGGGFLIVPALVGAANLPVRDAVGNSLALIAAQSLAGVVGTLAAGTAFDWAWLGALAAITLGGLAVGLRLGRTLAPARLRVTTAVFMLGVTALILGVELSG